MRLLVPWLPLRPVLQFALVLAACIASGTLECSSHGELTPAQSHGATLYVRMCAVCHARNGDGYAADQAPALANQEFLSSVTDDYLRTAIAHGRAGTTMSAWSTDFGGPLKHDDVDAVVAFLRSWQYRPKVTLDEHPAIGDEARGGDLFARE